MDGAKRKPVTAQTSGVLSLSLKVLRIAKQTAQIACRTQNASGVSTPMEQTHDFEIFLVATPGLEAPLHARSGRKGFAEAKIVPGRGKLQREAGPKSGAPTCACAGPTRYWSVWAVSRRCIWPNSTNAPANSRGGRSAPRHPGQGRGHQPQSHVSITRARPVRGSNGPSPRHLGLRFHRTRTLRVLLRIEKDICTFSVDTSGEPLHKRGHKPAVAKAPMRETMAAMFLRECGFDGSEPVLDPMCGSGTFVIEAAEIAMGLNPGRSRQICLSKI